MTARVHRATTWPLLRKDLTEMAAQPRAYWLRMLCVAVLYLLFLFLLPGESAYYYNEGAGHRMFQTLNFQLAVCLTVCAPAAVASAISGEKERNAFALLLVTNLRPRELLLQKYLARLIPVFGLMLCALPLYAVCYSHGGVEPQALAGAACLQTLVLLQAGAVALLMSCFYQTTTAAMATSWVFFALLMGGGMLLDEAGFSEDEAWAFFGIYHAAEGSFRQGFLDEVWRMACLAGSTAALLLLARFFLLRRAARRPGNPLLRLTRWMHAYLDRAIGRGRRSILPGVEAAAWRERHRLGIPNTRFSVRIAVAALLPMLLLAVAGLGAASRLRDELVVLGHLGLWFAVGTGWLALGVAAARSDQNRRTAETLRITPMGLVETIRARGAALTRFSLLLLPALLVPSLTHLFLCGLPAHPDYMSIGAHRALFALAANTGMLLVYPRLYLWLGLLLGLVFRSNGRALAVGWVGCLLWTVGGLLGVEYFGSITSTDWDDIPAYVLSPANVLTRMVYNGSVAQPELQAYLAVNFAVYALLALGLRWWALRRVGRD